jgi:hypothetical protein
LDELAQSARDCRRSPESFCSVHGHLGTRAAEPHSD